MTEPEFERDDTAADRIADEAELNRDPGADLDLEGVPEVGDESTPGRGEIPDPDEPVAPTEAPTAVTAHGVTEMEEAEGEPLEDRLAAEEPEVYELDDLEAEERAGSAEERALHEEGEEPPPLEGEPSLEGEIPEDEPPP